MIEMLAQASDSQQANPLMGMAPLVLIGLAMYFLMIRPQQRRAKQQRALLSEIEEGDEIMTTGGIFGTVTDIDEEADVLTVEIAPGTSVKMVRGGISRRITEDDYEEDEAEDEGVDADQ